MPQSSEASDAVTPFPLLSLPHHEDDTSPPNAPTSPPAFNKYEVPEDNGGAHDCPSNHDHNDDSITTNNGTVFDETSPNDPANLSSTIAIVPSSFEDADAPFISASTAQLLDSSTTTIITANFPAPKTNKPRPHVCTTCKRSFARLEHLKRHERSHTKEKPFECPECNRCFARRDLLLRHQQKLHQTSTPSARARGRRESTGAVPTTSRARKNSVAGVQNSASTSNLTNVSPMPMRPRANTISHIDAPPTPFLASTGPSPTRAHTHTRHSSTIDLPLPSSSFGLPYGAGGLTPAIGPRRASFALSALETLASAGNSSSGTRGALPRFNHGSSSTYVNHSSDVSSAATTPLHQASSRNSTANHAAANGLNNHGAMPFSTAPYFLTDNDIGIDLHNLFLNHPPQPASSTINPNVLHYDETPQSMAMDPASPFSFSYTNHASVQDLDDTFDWAECLQQLSFNNDTSAGPSDSAIDRSSPSAISTASQSGMNDVLFSTSSQSVTSLDTNHHHHHHHHHHHIWTTATMASRPHLDSSISLDLDTQSMFPDIMDETDDSPQLAPHRGLGPDVDFMTPPRSLSSLSLSALSVPADRNAGKDSPNGNDDAALGPVTPSSMNGMASTIKAPRSSVGKH